MSELNLSVIQEAIRESDEAREIRIEEMIARNEAYIREPATMQSPVYDMRYMPWDEISCDVRGLETVREALIKYNLNWKVAQDTIHRSNGTVIPNRVLNYRVDTNQPIEVVSNRYSVVQNEDAFLYLENAIGAGALKLVSVGSYGFSKIYIVGMIDKAITVLGDTIKPYVMFMNGHDGTYAIKTCITPGRGWCANAVPLLLKGMYRTWQTKHIGDVAQRVDEAAHLMGCARQYLDEYHNVAEKMVQINLSQADIEEVFREIFPVPVKVSQKKLARIANAETKILRIYNDTPDIKKFNGTAWGFWLAIADYATHEPAIRKTADWKQSRLNMITSGHPMLETAQKALIEIAA